MLTLPSSALALALLTSLARTANAQCFNNKPKDNDSNCGGGWNWNDGDTTAIAIAIAALLVFVLLLLYTAIIRRRRYALSQHPGVKPPMFGTAPPPGYAYTNGLPFWNINADTNRAPAPAYEAEMAPPAYPYGKPVREGGKAGNENVQGYACARASATGPYGRPAGPPPVNSLYAPHAGPPPPPQAHTAGEHGYGLRRQQ